MLLDQPTVLLRLEGLALAAGALALFLWMDGTWWWVPVLFLVPDLSMAGYLAGPRVGAMTYNAVHATVLPTVVGLIGLAVSNDLTMLLALIWLFHIGVDRLISYGLKEPTGFGATHLGGRGPVAQAASH
jgi:hypothetical protein